jgi:hypothetical protein
MAFGGRLRRKRLFAKRRQQRAQNDPTFHRFGRPAVEPSLLKSTDSQPWVVSGHHTAGTGPSLAAKVMTATKDLAVHGEAFVDTETAEKLQELQEIQRADPVHIEDHYNGDSEQADVDANRRAKLEKLSITKLRKLSKGGVVKGGYAMHKDELVDALVKAGVDA